MKAAVLREYGKPLTVEEVILDAPRAGEVRVGIEATGICHSDVATCVGDSPNPLPCIPGHEGAGTVLEVGPGVTTVKVGDKVMLSWAPDCGKCFNCRSGHPNLCTTYAPICMDGGLLDGTSRLHSADGEDMFHYSFLSTWASEVVVAEASCIPIVGEVPMDIAALIGCAVMTGYGAAVKSGQVTAGDTVVVFGAGGVGASAIQGARIAGATRIIAVDAMADKEAGARKYGATHFINVKNADPLEAIMELTDGFGADVVIEATGVPACQEIVFPATRRGGRGVFVGVAPVGTTVNLNAQQLARQEKVMTGSYYGGAIPAVDFQHVVDQYLKGALLLDDMVEGVYKIEEINEAIANKPKTGVRNVITFA
jgi:S-(hydroxymethyl)glutathione dehydrogenase/alcohol dehydrogenase